MQVCLVFFACKCWALTLGSARDVREGGRAVAVAAEQQPRLFSIPTGKPGKAKNEKNAIILFALGRGASFSIKIRVDPTDENWVPD